MATKRVSILAPKWGNFFEKLSLVRQSLNTYTDKLEHENPETRAIAAYAIGWLKRKKSLPNLINTLKNDPDENVRAICIMALRLFNNPKIIHQSLFCLNDNSFTVKIAFIDYLTEYSYDKVKHEIIKDIKNPNRELIFSVLQYVSRLNLIEFKEKVYSLIDSKDVIIIQNVILTLTDLKAKEYVHEIEKRFIEHENPLISMTAEWMVESLG